MLKNGMHKMPNTSVPADGQAMSAATPTAEQQFRMALAVRDRVVAFYDDLENGKGRA